MFSIYTSLYHIEKHSFSWQESLENFVKFAGNEGEVIIAINKSEDNTLEIIKKFASKNPIIKIIETNYLYTNIEMDGLIKNAALQVTTKPIKIQMDCDEIFYTPNKNKWIQYGEELLKSKIDCLMIPSVDLFKSRETIKATNQIGLKFRMHKIGLKRGVWKEARRGDKINTSMSDTCELLDQNGNLAISQSIVPSIYLNPLFMGELKNYLWTYHLGYLDLNQRININKKLWSEHWKLRSGKEENVTTDIKELESQPLILHNLPIE